MPERRSFLLRIDPAILDAVQRWANDDLRSLNGQIEFLLRRSLDQNGRAPRRGTSGIRPDADGEPPVHPSGPLAASKKRD